MFGPVLVIISINVRPVKPAELYKHYMIVNIHFNPSSFAPVCDLGVLLVLLEF